jgi:branched-chain amino acid transport system ATP-binding protein
MLAIGRALMINPILLLLDEPMEGLAPIVVQELTRVIGQMVTQTGMGIILVEQHARLALRMTKQAIVLDRGRIVHHGPSDELLRDEAKLDRLVAVA